ncbi:exportin 7, partial [Trifolium pratense]
VTTPLLKFVAELVLNKSQRLTFDSSSPNGILLFREVSKLIVAYGSRILTLSNKADMYTSKYKGISICLIILARALSGNFVNFGIFELYGDRALVDALDIIIKLLLSIPIGDIFAFRKVAASYFAFLETLFNGHLSFVLNLDKTGLMLIFGSLESGIKDLSEKISSQCASAIDNLATFYFNHVTIGESVTSPAALRTVGLISEFPQLFSRILRTLFEVVVLEDRGNLWTLSRAILNIGVYPKSGRPSVIGPLGPCFGCLVLAVKGMFANTKAQILASYVSPELSVQFPFSRMSYHIN